MSETKYAAEAGVDQVRPTKKERFNAHCKKWWWAHVIGFCLFVLGFMLIFVYAVYPAIAQSTINKTQFNLGSLKILNPTPKSFEVSIEGTITGIHGPGKNAKLDGFDVAMYLDGKDPATDAVMVMPLDGIKGAEVVPIKKDSYKVNIENHEALEEFALKLMEEKSMGVNMKGRTTVRLGAIKTKTNYNERIEMIALNKLDGMVITSYHPKSAYFNLEGRVLIPNPGVITVQMGDVALDISIGKDKIGTGIIPNLTVVPGLTNTYFFRAAVPTDKVPAMLGVAIGKGNIIVSSNGTSIDGEQIPYLSKPLTLLAATVPINKDYFKEQKLEEVEV